MMPWACKSDSGEFIPESCCAFQSDAMQVFKTMKAQGTQLSPPVKVEIKEKE